MTVQQLIVELQKMPQEWEVEVQDVYKREFAPLLAEGVTFEFMTRKVHLS